MFDRANEYRRPRKGFISLKLLFAKANNSFYMLGKGEHIDGLNPFDLIAAFS